MIIYGIDPGATSGGIARFDGGWWVSPMPTIDVIADKLEEDMLAPVKSVHVFLEKAQAMPKNGAVSMFNYGTHYGQILGVLITLKVPHTLVHPRTWCRVIHSGTKAGAPKIRTLEAIKRLFPGQSLIPDGSRGRTPHSGITDAMAIAEHGRRLLRA